MQAFLTKYAPVRDSHQLILTSLDNAISLKSLDKVLSAMVDGSMEPILDFGDDLLWADALASPEHEF